MNGDAGESCPGADSYVREPLNFILRADATSRVGLYRPLFNERAPKA